MKTPALIIAALLVLPTLASAQTLLLDTGVPASTNGPLILSSAQSLAAEFSANAGTNIDELSVYLTKGTPDSFFTFNLYSGAAGLPSNSNRSAQSIFATTGEYTADGWSYNASAINFTLPTTGSYWVAVSTSSGTFDTPLETGTTTGTAPATSFAFASSGKFTVSDTPTNAFGIQVNAAAVPEPSAWALTVICAGLFVGLRRRFARA